MGIEEKSKNKKPEVVSNGGDGGQALKQHSKTETMKKEKIEDKTSKEVSTTKQAPDIVAEPKKIVEESKAVKTESSNIDVDKSSDSNTSSVSKVHKKVAEKESNSERLDIPKVEKVKEIDSKQKWTNSTSSNMEGQKKVAEEERSKRLVIQE